MRAKLGAHFQQVSNTVSTTKLSASNWHTSPTRSALLNDWLFDQGSLTQRLSQLCSDKFNVQPLSEGWQTLTDNECQALNVANNSCGWVREVFLSDGQRPWVFARSVAGQKELQASGFDISQLGTRSLGELLFSQQAFSRGILHICQLSCLQLPDVVQQYATHTNNLWARRSCFQKNTLGVLVAEVFLPNFWQDNHFSPFDAV